MLSLSHGSFFVFYLHFKQDAQAFAEENNLIFTESSAKTGMCVGDIFMSIGKV